MLRKIIVRVGVLAVLAGLVPAVTATTAVAATCYGVSCNGVDPQKSGCSSGARTLDEVDGPSGVTVELRYSPTCNAVWTRVDNWSGRTGVAKVIGYYRGEFYREELRTLAAYRGEVTWTKMITSTVLTYGCFRAFKIQWYEWCTAGH